MRLGLLPKLTMIMTGLVLLSTAVLSLVFSELLLQQVLHDTDRRATELAREAFDSARRALEDAKAQGLRPASEDPQEIHDYVAHAFEISDGLSAKLQTAKDLPFLYEMTIVDKDGIVLVSSDPAQVGKTALHRPSFSQLVQSSFVRQVRALAEQGRIYDVDYPFKLRGNPFGEVRVAVSTALLFDDIKPRLQRWGTIALLALVLSTILAAVVSGAALTPIRDILGQLERISVGVYDAPATAAKGPTETTDEICQVRQKIQQVGQQLRAVNEIFNSF